MSGPAAARAVGGRRGRLLLALAAVAVGFAAADTYVVVLALPDMMAGAGLAVDELNRAAPIVSGFLLGYVAVLPLVGRVADLRGRVPVLVGSLVLFALGSLVTAAAYDLPSMVVGRFAQGVGGGGMVPATLAMVADLYPPQRRGVPLGVVGAVQELGSVLGPLYGAVVLAVAPWQAIFALNLLGGAVLAVAVHAAAGGRGRGGPGTAGVRLPDPVGLLLAGTAMVLLLVVMLEPALVATDVTWGLALVPLVGGSRWAAPAALVMVVAVLALVGRCLTARRPLLDVRRAAALRHEVDLAGAALLSVALGSVVLAFTTADPEVSVLSPSAPWVLGVGAVAAVGFTLRNRRAAHPLVPPDAVRARPAWGALLVSFFAGAALVAALVDVPLFARLTVSPGSQLGAALVLVRLLVALPVGAVVGGRLTRRLPVGVVTAGGMALSAVGFAWMATWGATSLESPVATVPLVVTGLGFGLAIAPVNAALLAATATRVHGVASALVVVARMVGMLVGLSLLTVVGLRRYYAEQAGLPSPAEVCAGRTQCPAYTALLTDAGLTQLQTVFVGAAGCAAVAGVLALLVFRGVGTRPAGRVGAAGLG